MAELHTRIKAFVKLGDIFRKFCESDKNQGNFSATSEVTLIELNRKIEDAHHHNGWFTRENVVFALKSWAELLQQESLENWLTPYDLETNQEKKVALIMAGNIPLVGFHDLLCVLITGNSALIKLSSNDKVLLPFVTEKLCEIEPSFKGKISYTEAQLEGFQAVIATGSNNTARYFDYYFGKYPNIIRKNRNSIAVLKGTETPEQLKLLGEDIFRYYGLGCRSVSKIYVPLNYNFDTFFEAMFAHKDIINEQKYANNYDYNKAVYLMSEFSILDNGFLLLKEDKNYGSPIATIFYEYYDSEASLKSRLQHDAEMVQCLVGDGFQSQEVSFGKTQQPELSDYADGIDTVEFLLKT